MVDDSTTVEERPDGPSFIQAPSGEEHARLEGPLARDGYVTVSGEISALSTDLHPPQALYSGIIELRRLKVCARVEASVRGFCAEAIEDVCSRYDSQA